MDAFFNFFTEIHDWLTSGIYDFAVSAMAYFIEKATLAYLAFLNAAIPFAWNVAEKILNDLNVSAQINAAWAEFPSMSRAVMTALKIPEVLNTLLTGFATKFVIRFIPGM